MTRDDAVRLAEQIVGLVGLGDLSMAMLTGSLARDIGDESSDVDIHLYGPDVDATSMPQAGFEPLGARHVFAVPTPTGWFTKLQIDGRYCDVEAVDVAVLDRAADSLAGAAAPPGWAVKLAAGLRDAVSVQGEQELASWRQRLRYRDGTAACEVAARTGRLLAPSALYELTYARGDLLSFTARISQVLLDVVALLAAVNRRFVPVDDPKWLPWHLTRLEHRPADSAERIRAGLDDPSPTTMADLDTLVAEALDLVDRHVPGTSTGAARFAITLRPRPAR